VPWVLVSYSPDETARCLLLQTGSVKAAHQAVTRNADVLKKPKRDVDDKVLLLAATAIQRRDKGTVHAALCEATRLVTDNPDAAETIVRRLRRTLRGRTLEQFAKRYPPWAISLPVFGH
jgi:hypothetical protein